MDAMSCASGTKRAGARPVGSAINPASFGDCRYGMLNVDGMPGAARGPERYGMRSMGSASNPVETEAAERLAGRAGAQAL